MRRRRRGVSRRYFVLQGGLLLTAGGMLLARLFGFLGKVAQPVGRAPIRPPSALEPDESFRAACIRCGLCGTVCENGCIRYFGLDEPTYGSLTPYIDVRARSCTLCMRCTHICPTGALSPVSEPDNVDLARVAREVRMGTAVVDPDRCLSFLGRLCGYCHDACPLPGKAIRLVPAAKPIVLEQSCVGCGRCVELCPQTPRAIDVSRLAV
ncbi:MAG: 4Fe-4S dicluster domain-containing protein [Proteobacteria bacterium]|nr:4Fe-4S dicluster domain-containing protein [Pseudomonadota bacterium]